MSTLNLARAQITGLIDGWSRSRWQLFKAKAKKFEGRVATALVLSLEGDSSAALASLTTRRQTSSPKEAPGEGLNICYRR
jgi:hypothetical protein